MMLVVSLMAAWQGWSHGAHGLGRSVVPQTAQTSLPRRAKMHTSFEASSNPDACSEFFPPRVCLPSAGLTQQFRFYSAKLAENTFATSDECWVRTDTSKNRVPTQIFSRAYAATITTPSGTLPPCRLTIGAIVSLITHHL